MDAIIGYSRLVLVVILLQMLLPAVFAQESAADSGDVVDFVLSLNPFVLIAAGVLLILASGLARIIAVMLVIVGLASLILSII